MPALQQVYYAVTQLRYAEPALKTLHKEIQSLPVNTSLKKDETCLDALALTRNIALKNISYSYPNTLRTVVRDLSLTIPAMSTIGFVGETGSGKTTIADLILGILHPKMGRIEVDGKIINEHNRRYWQRSIGYVPQQIYLADDTIAANIAFGCDASEINYEDVERAAKIANLHEFVSSELPDGYRTTIGERGVRLSGGQRQRIGIARALYHKPQLIILDEATSALDNLTEQVVMEAVHNLGREVTIILIAHRLSTVQDCDVIFLLERGVVTGHGKYSELIQKNERFRKMASIG
jgi:ABC-type multidrug transport system fused ATPase/permease subunit